MKGSPRGVTPTQSNAALMAAAAAVSAPSGATLPAPSGATVPAPMGGASLTEGGAAAAAMAKLQRLSVSGHSSAAAQGAAAPITNQGEQGGYRLGALGGGGGGGVEAGVEAGVFVRPSSLYVSCLVPICLPVCLQRCAGLHRTDTMGQRLSPTTMKRRGLKVRAGGHAGGRADEWQAWGGQERVACRKAGTHACVRARNQNGGGMDIRGALQ